MTDIISIRNLSKAFADRLVLADINLEVAQGEAVVLLGRSGAGKTTLLRCLNLLEVPTSGTITVNRRSIFADGKALAARDLVGLRQQLGMVFQSFGLFPHLTALENITMPLMRGAGIGRDEAIARALKGLDDVGLAPHAFDLPTTLSGGQQQRVAVARALALKPAALLFDEPTSALDVETISGLVAVLNELKKQAMTMVIVTHDVSFAVRVADRIAFMKDGRIRAIGTPKFLLEESDDPEVRSFFSHR